MGRADEDGPRPSPQMQHSRQTQDSWAPPGRRDWTDKREPLPVPRKNDPEKSQRQSYLTERQKQILDFIAEFQAEKGISPTHREIRDHFGYSSFGTVYKHLQLLQKKGFLHRDWNQKRGLELIRAIPGRPGETDVPFLGLIAAGQPIEALPHEERLAVPNHLFNGPSAEHYVLRVRGESMIDDGIHDGDYVVVRRREQVRPGEMVVALVGNDEVTLKRFFPEGDKVRLEPANSQMHTIWVKADDVEVQGVVVGLMRRY
jgi:repressor LexA